MRIDKFRGLLLAASLSLSPVMLTAQNANGNVQSVTAANSMGGVTVNPQSLTLTVHEAWVQSARNEDKFFDMVKQFAQMSAEKRGVTLPNTEAAGVKMGTLIKTSARRDPDQLLYAVVDSAVRQTSKTSIASAK